MIEITSFKANAASNLKMVNSFTQVLSLVEIITESPSPPPCYLTNYSGTPEQTV